MTAGVVSGGEPGEPSEALGNRASNEPAGWIAGKTIVSLESRFPREFAGLIERRGGKVIQAPSIKEVPDPDSPSVAEFVEGVCESRFAVVVLLTGVGTRMCIEAAGRGGREEEFLAGLREATVVCRGPKPVAVLRKNDVEPSEMAPEPHTSEELAGVLRRRAGELTGKNVALQHYGVDNPYIREVLESVGAEVFDVYPYTWGLPDDVGPLEQACRIIAERRVDAVCFTSSPQVANMVEVASRVGLLADLKAALAQAVVPAAVGPVAAAALKEVGIRPLVEPSRPKMADLVRALDSFTGSFGG